MDRSVPHAQSGVLRSSTLQVWTQHLQLVDSEQPPQRWPRDLDANLLAITSALVQGVAGEQPAAWLQFVAVAVQTGRIELIWEVAAAFGGRGRCRWQHEDPSKRPLATAARCLCRALQWLPPPLEVGPEPVGPAVHSRSLLHGLSGFMLRLLCLARGPHMHAKCSFKTCTVLQMQGHPWPEAHRSLVLHFCRLAAVLLDAGCPPACIRIIGQDVPRCILHLHGGPALLEAVPWAREVLR